MNQRTLILLTFTLSGIAALIYEVVWFRPLTLIFGSTIYATSILVAAFLGGLSIGSWLFGSYADQAKSPLKAYALIELGIGFYGLMLIYLFNFLPHLYLNLYHAFSSVDGLFFASQFILSFAVVLIPATLMGATWPIVNKAYTNKNKVGEGVGSLYTVNTIGAVVGTLLAGFVLLPLFGVKWSMIVAACINLSVFSLIFLNSKFKNSKILTSAIVLFILAIIILPAYDIGLVNSGVFVYAEPSMTIEKIGSYADRASLVSYEEGLYGTVTVQEIGSRKVLKINGKTQCSDTDNAVTIAGGIAETPYVVFMENYDRRPGNAMTVGLGCGITSGYLVGQDVLTTTVEIDRSVVRASSFFNNVNGNIHESDNHNLVVDDARNWLLLSDEKFDIISTQPADPWTEMSTNLFSQEFFSIVNDHLTTDGIFSQWVPVFEMEIDDFEIFYNTFHSVFPYVYAYHLKQNSHEFVFLGSNEPLEVASEGLYLFDQDDVPEFDSPLNTDDMPLLEFSTAKNIYNENPLSILEEINRWRNDK
jgi:spermidine synthase